MENINRGEHISRSVSKYINFAILIVLLIILSPRTYEFIKLEINRLKWNIHTVTHYRYKLKALCHCSQIDETPVIIEVQDGRIVSVIDVNGVYSEWNGNNSYFLGGDKTAEGLFNQIQKENFKDDWIHVDYDGKYGFPLVMMFDRIRNGIDDELMYTISDFEILP